jgi:GR25 family glycosyltransferase involved in LPS biosynthesis
MEKLLIILILFFLLILFCNKDNSLIEKFSNNNDFGFYVLYIPKRYDYIKNVMNKVNIIPNFIRGPKKDKLIYDKLVLENLVSQSWLDDSKAKKKYVKPINKGRIACHLGHAKILTKFLKSGQKYALIFEDDLNISIDKQEFRSKLQNILSNIPEDAEIVYLSYCFEVCQKLKKINNIFSKAYRPLCRHMYLVSREGANKILRETFPMHSSGDRMIGMLIKNKILNGYVVNHDFLNINQFRENGSILETTLNNYQPHRLCL